MIKNNGYATGTAIDCFSTCLSNYLMYDGIDMSVEEAFIIGGGMRSQFDKSSSDAVKPRNTVTDIYLSAAEKLGIPVIYDRCIGNPGDFLINCIRKEKQIMIRLSTKYLKYDPIFQHNDEMGHFVNVIGYENDEVYFSDGYVPNRIVTIYEGTMKLDEMLGIWKTKDFVYAIVDINRHDHGIISSRLEGRDRMKSIKDELLRYISGETDDGIPCSSDAVKAFAHSLKDMINVSEEVIARKTYKMVYDMKLLGFFISKVCIQKIIRNNDSISAEICGEYDRILNSWNAVFLKILKIRYFPTPEYVQKLTDKIVSLNNEECDIYKMIIKYDY